MIAASVKKRNRRNINSVYVEEITLKQLKLLFMVLVVILFVVSSASAADFDWVGGFNVKAETDLSDFRTRLAARFNIDNTIINAVLSNVEEPADAYIMLRLGEMSNHPVNYVIEKYKSNKSKGWGALAKSLGIKPGSGEFHDLKQSQNLYDVNGKKNKAKGKGKK